jgi:hypothetical protein
LIVRSASWSGCRASAVSLPVIRRASAMCTPRSVGGGYGRGRWPGAARPAGCAIARHDAVGNSRWYGALRGNRWAARYWPLRRKSRASPRRASSSPDSAR